MPAVTSTSVHPQARAANGRIGRRSLWEGPGRRPGASSGGFVDHVGLAGYVLNHQDGPRPLLAPRAAPNGSNHPIWGLLARDRHGIAHDFGQFVERSEVTVIGFKAIEGQERPLTCSLTRPTRKPLRHVVSRANPEAHLGQRL